MIPTPPKYDVFLSYSRKNADTKDRVVKALRDAGFAVWVDDHLVPGTEDWQREIEDAIRDTICVVVLLSPTAHQSKWVRIELNLAAMRKRQIIPMLVEAEKDNEVDSIPAQTVLHQYIEARGDSLEPALDKLATVVGQYKELYRQGKQEAVDRTLEPAPDAPEQTQPPDAPSPEPQPQPVPASPYYDQPTNPIYAPINITFSPTISATATQHNDQPPPEPPPPKPTYPQPSGSNRRWYKILAGLFGAVIPFGAWLITFFIPNYLPVTHLRFNCWANQTTACIELTSIAATRTAGSYTATFTSLPSATDTPTLPSETPIPLPSATDTPTLPSETPIPLPSATDTPTLPSETPIPLPSATDTPTVPPDTSIPPTADGTITIFRKSTWMEIYVTGSPDAPLDLTSLELRTDAHSVRLSEIDEFSPFLSGISQPRCFGFYLGGNQRGSIDPDNAVVGAEQCDGASNLAEDVDPTGVFWIETADRARPLEVFLNGLSLRLCSSGRVGQPDVYRCEIQLPSQPSVPSGFIPVGGFIIMEALVTQAEMNAFIENGYRDDDNWSDDGLAWRNDSSTPPGDDTAAPALNAVYYLGEAYCASMGGRLPSVEELDLLNAQQPLTTAPDAPDALEWTSTAHPDGGYHLRQHNNGDDTTDTASAERSQPGNPFIGSALMVGFRCVRGG